MDKTRKILKDIESGYNRIADKFSFTRNFFWKELAFLADYIKDGDTILDFGCGNGRLLEILKKKDVKYQGVDVSSKLIEKAKEKYSQYNFSKIEAQESLPFSPNFFNVIFSIAVFHHFPFEYQKEKIKELYNLLKTGGIIILTVWNLQDKYQEKEIKIPFQDNNKNVFERYHFVFSKDDLKNLVEQAGFQMKKCDIIGEKNILIIAKK